MWNTRSTRLSTICERDLAAEVDLDAPAGHGGGSARAASRAAVLRRPSSSRTPSRGRPVHFSKASSATEVSSSILPVTPPGAMKPRSASRSCVPRRLERTIAVVRLADRAAQVVAGEQADRDAALDPHADAEHSGDGAERADELADAGAQRGLVAAGREPRAEVDGDDAPGDADVPDRRARGDRAPSGRWRAHASSAPRAATARARDAGGSAPTATGCASSRNQTGAYRPRRSAREPHITGARAADGQQRSRRM